jgi:hypothetical protein
MVLSERQRASARLHESIVAYRAESEGRLDHHALDVLRRLADSRDAAKAFKRFRNEDASEDAITQKLILKKCIQAELIARTFPQRIIEADARLKQTGFLRNAVVILREFVDSVIAEEQAYYLAPDSLSPFGWPSSEDILTMKRGLRLIEYEIVERQDIARDDPRRLGATRKSRDKKAAQIAAFRWLAKAVRGLTGKSHESAVADLAQVILGVEVSVDQVRPPERPRGRQTPRNKRRIRNPKSARTRL